MARHDDAKGIGTTGLLGALAAVLVVAQFGVPLIGAPGEPEPLAPLHEELVGAHIRVLDDLLVAGFSPDGAATAGGVFHDVVSGSDRDRLELVADLDGDGISERLRYEVRDRTLVRTRFVREAETWKPSSEEVIAEDVEEFTVAFLDQTRSVLAAEEVTRGRDARSVQVSLRLSRNGSAGRTAETFSGEVALRNLAG